MLRIDVITLFPEVIEAGVGYSIVGRAREWGLVQIRAIQLRDFAEGKHKKTDDEPYGGGAGLVMKPEPIFRAVEFCMSPSSHDVQGEGTTPRFSSIAPTHDLTNLTPLSPLSVNGEGGAPAPCAASSPSPFTERGLGGEVEKAKEKAKSAPEAEAGSTNFIRGTATNRSKTRIILLEPQGKLYTQAKAQEFSEQEHLILICGHYEGVDARVRDHLATDVISIGDYVLTGGELPALILIDSVVRLLPGAIHSPESLGQDSYADGLLGYPQYTRPEVFRGMRVPQVLLSGNHGAIARWRRQEQLRLTRALRPDLFARACLTQEDLRLLREMSAADSDNMRP